MFKDFRRCYEEFRLTQTQEHKETLTSLLKRENSEKVDHPHRCFFSLFGSGLFNYNLIDFSKCVSNAVMAQTFLPGMTNRNTGMSRHEIQVFDP